MKISISFFVFFTLLNIIWAKNSLKATTVFSNDNADEEVDRDNKSDERINLSAPGTKWCGPGNTANNYSDLGTHSDTDQCCRAHDHCDNIASGETKHGLRNNDLFTRLHCRCDQEFKYCLKQTKNSISHTIGMTYFTVRDRCYKKEYPMLECQKYDNRFGGFIIDFYFFLVFIFNL